MCQCLCELSSALEAGLWHVIAEGLLQLQSRLGGY